MSTDKASIGPVVLEIALKLLEHSYFFHTTIAFSMYSINP